jgi:transcriptional regulator with XRE-family HTH domain
MFTYAEQGARLKARREELGRTIAGTARLYAHDAASIQFYERGRSRPHIGHVDALAAAYQLPRNELRAMYGYELVPDDQPSSLDRLIELESLLDRLVRALTEAVSLVQAIRTQTA